MKQKTTMNGNGESSTKATLQGGRPGQVATGWAIGRSVCMLATPQCDGLENITVGLSAGTIGFQERCALTAETKKLPLVRTLQAGRWTKRCSELPLSFSDLALNAGIASRRRGLVIKNRKYLWGQFVEGTNASVCPSTQKQIE